MSTPSRFLTTLVTATALFVSLPTHAQGVEVVSKNDIPQWEPFERQSMLGELRNITCGLDPARMRSSAK